MAVIVVLVEPVTVGVPLIVEPEMVSPAGSGDAVHDVAVFDVVMEYETACPFVPVADSDEVMTGG